MKINIGDTIDFSFTQPYSFTGSGFVKRIFQKSEMVEIEVSEDSDLPSIIFFDEITSVKR